MQTLTIICRRLGLLLCGVALLAPGSLRAGANEHGSFAVPRQFAVESGGFGMLRVCLALALVLASVYAVAWLLRRLRGGVGGSSAQLCILSQVSLGARERAVLLRVGERHLLLGVAAGSVRLLQEITLTAAPASPGAATGTVGDKPNFRELLRRSLGR
jgi:flagellar protein FliO/FliZ